MRVFIIITFVFSVLWSATADMRIWRDKKGNAIEAELVTMNAIQVVLRGQDGKTFKFHPSKLSEDDQKYLKTAFPPEMDIEFKKKSNRNKQSSSVTISSEISLTKKEQRAYDKSMKVVLIIIGKSRGHDDYVVLDRVESSFNFKTKPSFNLKGNTFVMALPSKYIDSNGKKHESGIDYKSYLAVVLDDKGNIVAKKSGNKDFAGKCSSMIRYKAKDRFRKAGEGTSGSIQMIDGMLCN